MCKEEWWNREIKIAKLQAYKLSHAYLLLVPNQGWKHDRTLEQAKSLFFSSLSKANDNQSIKYNHTQQENCLRCKDVVSEAIQSYFKITMPSQIM